MIASGRPYFIMIVCWIFFLIPLSRRFMIFFLYFLNSIRAHVGHTTLATLQIELYRVVDYDSKWSTKLYKDCMLEII